MLLFTEYIWLLPEAGDGNQIYGGDDGSGGWMPLAVATANGTAGVANETLRYIHSTHLGVPVGTYSSTGTASPLPAGTMLLGFPGQQQTLADLYYNQYRDYDPTTGRYIQADPIGLAGDANPYNYANSNPVGMVDPMGLDALVIIGGRTSGNPFGHVAIAFTGRGVFSFGTGHRCGSSTTQYLIDQASYRHSYAYRLRTNRTQEQRMLAAILRHCANPRLPPVRLDNLLNVIVDTCATRTQDALSAGGFWTPYGPSFSPLPVHVESVVHRNGGELELIAFAPSSVGDRAKEFDP